MIYKVFPRKGKLHLWAFENFKEETKAETVDFSLDGNTIIWITYKVKSPVSNRVFARHGLSFTIVSN